MPDTVPDPVLREVVAEIRAWSATRCHEPSPHDIRVVATTRDAAHALLYPGTGSSEDPVFFAVARGDFHLTGSGHTRNGVWAGLFVKYPPARVTSFTLRPEAYIPVLDLAGLGRVYPAPGPPETP
ncbi:hypothetical protein [Streptomyces scabiei]|uniref:Uncharacterized protein n=1 Tax=Streptomyces scabiei TaxID=1930 RepID=A0A117EFU5_STRSC|nr:hypothetical protein [Streptomyces scabiei]GAQ66140.1 hypothetical protein SsS58_06570 [Streptomyces scabiei]